MRMAAPMQPKIKPNVASGDSGALRARTGESAVGSSTGTPQCTQNFHSGRNSVSQAQQVVMLSILFA